MKRFEIEYKPTPESDTTEMARVTATNERKAFKAFSIKVPGIPENQLVSINGQPIGEGNSDTDQTANPHTSSRARQDNQNDEIFPGLGILGVLMILGGGYILLVEPGTRTEVGNIVNLQKLIIGQTLAISGVIFVAAQWRPRRR